ncbi:DUF6266 family protein, partial [Pararcticibacter amylolyticus]|uniref:DUF6266 family protein n=1 Tax=Pararcticibacter amylolyticus TaxID=2173175 RepID=UPI001304F2DF
MNISTRKVPGAKKGAPSMAQQANRAKFALAAHFLSPLMALLNAVYQTRNKQQGYHAALSHLLNFALCGDHPQISVNFPKVRLSNGRLCVPANTVLRVTGTSVTAEWPVVLNALALADDKVTVVLYSEQKDAFHVKRNEAKRKDGIYRFTMPEEFEGDRVHVYLFFVSRTGKSASRSVYLGEAS